MTTAPLSGDLTSEEVATLAEHFEPLRAEELVEFAAEAFGGRLVLTCSWQLGTSILVHMTRQVAPGTQIKPGAQRAAVRHAKDLPTIGNPWEPLGKTPLIANRPEYDTTLGSTKEGFVGLAGRTTTSRA